MNVSELITELSKLPANATVNVGTSNESDYYNSFEWSDKNIRAYVDTHDGEVYIESDSQY